MKVLWICNSILPAACEKMGIAATNKEGWLVGLADSIAGAKEGETELSVAAPVSIEFDGFKETINGVTYYGFYENTSTPWVYDRGLEERLKKIEEDAKPDVIHIFGTEFPHTLAMTRACENKEKILIGMQGACGPISEHYADGVPDKVIRRKTFRDFIKKDSIADQIDKFEKRAGNEKEALKNVLHVTGRTSFDQEYMLSVNPKLTYHFMNETLKSTFYEGQWDKSRAVAHRIFLSQGDYPVKGVHYMLKAAGILKEEYPDLEIYIAGNSITRRSNIKEKLKLPSYGKYLLELIKDNGLTGKVHVTGNIDLNKMKEMYLSADLFVCPSTIENSPNSVGEAMLLGVPVVCANVGGASSVMSDDVDGIMYPAGNVDKLVEAVRKMWTNEEFVQATTQEARKHARQTHDGPTNFMRLLEIYREICR